MGTFPGLDKDKLEQFRTFANGNPKDVTLDLEAKTVWDGHAVGHVGTVGPWTIAGQRNDSPNRNYETQFGMWKEVEEILGIPNPRDRTEAMEAALMGLASCVHTAICLVSGREGISFGGLEVTAKVKVDPRLLFGFLEPEDADDCIQSIDVDVKVDGDLSDAERRRVLEMANYSPVHLMVKQANTINTRLT